MTTQLTYKDAGVDISEGARLVDMIKPLARSTRRAGVMGGLGGFGALFSGRFKGLKDPVIISSTDGVGTKLMIAFMTDRHDTVGIDLVAMSVNDILVSGAELLFFLDYFATGQLDTLRAADVIKGIAKGCKAAGCALVGGETAEMPGLYKAGEYDLAGFAVGVVDKKKIIDGRKIKAGNTLIGIASSGLHSNGYSLARKVIFERMRLKHTDTHPYLKKNIGETLLTPTRIYVKPVRQLMTEINLLGMAHITGGGLVENVPRMLPKGLKAVIKKGQWPIPPIFKLIQEGGQIDDAEMARTFNCGIGMVLAVRQSDAEAAVKRLRQLKEKAYIIGAIAKLKGNEHACVVE